MVTIAGGHTRVVEVVYQDETRFALEEQQAKKMTTAGGADKRHAVADPGVCRAGAV